MSILDQFTLSSATPVRDFSPAVRFRRRLLDAVETQIAFAKAEIAGETFRPTRQKWVKNPTTRAPELRETPVRLRRWWWQDETKKVFLTLHLGTKPIELAPGKKSIEIGKLEDVPAKLALILEAVSAGEFDRFAAVKKELTSKTLFRKSKGEKGEALPSRVPSSKG